jgi:hypothetical protein
MLNEHHQTATCLDAAAPLMAAILARQTKNARICILGNPIANRGDPIRIAEERAIIDNISRGRLDVGIVRGVPYEIFAANTNPTQTLERLWEGVDLIVEVAPAQNARLDLAVIRNRGSIAVYANNGGDQMTLDVRQHFSLNVRYQFVLLYTVGMDAIRAAAEDINAALVDGALTVGEQVGLPLHRTDLAHTADAHALVESGAVGKVPPVAGLGTPSVHASGLRLAHRVTDMPTRLALVNSFASGGALFSVVVEVGA